MWTTHTCHDWNPARCQLFSASLGNLYRQSSLSELHFWTWAAETWRTCSDLCPGSGPGFHGGPTAGRWKLTMPCMTKRCLQQMGLHTPREQAEDVITSVVQQIWLQGEFWAMPGWCKVRIPLREDTAQRSSARLRYKKHIARLKKNPLYSSLGALFIDKHTGCLSGDMHLLGTDTQLYAQLH